MIVNNRLLTTGTVVISAIVSRNVHIATFQREFKIIDTWEGPLRIFKNLYKSSSVFANSNDSMPSYDSLQREEYKKTSVKPFLNVRTNLSPVECEISSNLRENIDPLNENSSKIIANGIDVGATTGKEEKIFKTSMTKQKYKFIRPWRPLASATSANNVDAHFVLKILSYNILAQNLLEDHKYLYVGHNKEALNWERRMVLVQKEILKAEANVICLQEMQVDHLDEFLVVFKKAGYDYLYKRRTNDKRDGLLLLYRSDQLKLVDHAKVELYQPNIDILNRDNVALVAKFSLMECPKTHVVVSTTHLLYNPKREDVRLAQTQLLLAELERMAFVKLTAKGPRYHPIILSGDFNLQPNTGVYRFITEGAFEFRGRSRSLEPALLCGLGNSLIPPSLLVTDNCQHYDILMKRLRGESDDALDKSDEQDKEKSGVSERSNDKSENGDKVDTRTFEYQEVKIVEGQYAKFSSGSLTHPFTLNSLYQHTNIDGEAEATTHQGKWVTVDYIFYSGVEPLSKYNLPTVSECKNLRRIPNDVVGSDHLCLGASFKLKKTKRWE